jgi:hypothetical protein
VTTEWLKGAAVRKTAITFYEIREYQLGEYAQLQPTCQSPSRPRRASENLGISQLDMSSHNRHTLSIGPWCGLSLSFSSRLMQSSLTIESSLSPILASCIPLLCENESPPGPLLHMLYSHRLQLSWCGLCLSHLQDQFNVDAG